MLGLRPCDEAWDSSMPGDGLVSDLCLPIESFEGNFEISLSTNK